jgi:hypothetical protein
MGMAGENFYLQPMNSSFMASDSTEQPYQIRKRNFRNVQFDGTSVGLASAARPFLPVFLARLGASSF